MSKCLSIARLAAFIWAAAFWSVESRAQVYRFEAEQGSLTGLNVASSAGTSYVTGFDNDADRLSIQANVPDGLYELWVRYQSPFSWKGYGVQVDGERGNGGFDSSGTQFRLDRAGVFNLTGATNTLQIYKDWGFYNVDYLELRPATIAPPAPVAPVLSDPRAGNRAQHLMNYLTSIYGSKTLAGQQSLLGQNGAFPSSDYLSESGGLVPAVRGSDFMDYSPSRRAFGANPNNETERIMNWAKQTGGIPTMSWHWNAPADLINKPGKEWWRGFYADATNFDLQAALANPGSEKYNLLLRDIDAIAVELKKFQTIGIPVLWRPLHEAQGSGGGTWFWWSEGGPQSFVQLWRLMHDRLTNVHDLHNLIWVYTSTPANEDFRNWYPGDDVVDIIGPDIYTDRTSSMSGQWYDLLDQYDGEKMIALTETGTLPDPTLFDDRGVHWSWFLPWSVDSSDIGIVPNYTPAQIQAVLGHDDVITLNELPLMPWSTSAAIDADFDNDGDADGGDFLAWQQQLGRTGGASADGNGDNVVDARDLALFRQLFGQGPAVAVTQGAVPEPAALGLMAIALSCVTANRNRRRRLIPC
jgi:mannan endo-1,4-beta-mannosidase